jgi:Flp pilus assembly protein TadB
MSVAVIYFAVSAAVGLPWAAAIFHAQRRLRMGNRGSFAEIADTVFSASAIGKPGGVILEACGFEGDAK